MRIFFLYLSLFSFCLLVSSQKVFSQKKKEIKTFKIKSETESVTEIIIGKEITHKDSYLSFDKNGNQLEDVKYNADGTVKKKITDKYDSFKNKIEEVEYDGAGAMTKKEQYSYNSKGDKTLEVEYDNSNKLVRKTVYVYDSKGLKVEKKVYNGDNVLQKSHRYTYEM